MPKRVAVMPILNEGHFIPHLVQNYVEVLGITHFVFNDGALPNGPEQQSARLPGWRSGEYFDKYTTDGKWSFDVRDLEDLLPLLAKKYDVDIKLVRMNYPAGCHSEEAFKMAFSQNLPELEPEDLVFPLEPDVMFLESDRSAIQWELAHIAPDSGIKVPYIRFFEAPFVVIDVALVRKVAIQYGTGELYKRFCEIMFWEGPSPGCPMDKLREYQGMLRPVNTFKGYHYEWVRPGRYMLARLAQIYRPDDLRPYKKEINFLRTHHRLSPHPGVDYFKYYHGPHPKVMHDHPAFLEYGTDPPIVS
jgi:hypothetical protein